MAKKDDQQLLKQQAYSSLTTFLFGTVIFFMFTTFFMGTTTDGDEASDFSDTLFKVFYVLLFIVHLIITNILLTENKMICGERNPLIATTTTIFPLIFIFFIGIFTIWAFPGWVDCFSETWGSSIINFVGITDSQDENKIKNNVNKVEEQKNHKRYSRMKKSIGEGIWYCLFGIITMLISFNSLLDQNCNAFSVKKDDFKRYLNDKYRLTGKKN